MELHLYLAESYRQDAETASCYGSLRQPAFGGGPALRQVEKLLGKKVAVARKAEGLTQSQLAERVGVTLDTISRLERGAAVPGLSRIEDIARVLKVPLWSLFQFDATPKSERLSHLVAMLEPRGEVEVALVHDVAAQILAAWPTAAPHGPDSEST